MTYKTRDSETAMILLSQNQRFSTQNDAGTIWFNFEDKATCETIVDAHINKELVVCSLDLTSAMHEIKKIIIRNKNI
ncbi:MAG: hypothetical protein ACD_7C00281G0002 [uncultured bacterium]|nr:MAG: hypothetical protein ACD_7C00281G0002 [uncultured bacterium]